jgi:hypothetical protein
MTTITAKVTATGQTDLILTGSYTIVKSDVYTAGYANTY